MEGNFGFVSTLLDTLKKYNNNCPVMLSSFIQATLIGRYGTSDYGKSKLAGEELFFDYRKETGAKVLVYRFHNLFGKWCRPNYNSAVATFCNNIANNLEITVNDRSTELELLYIYVSPNAHISNGCVILPGDIVDTGSRVRKGCVINLGATVDYGVVVEDGVHSCVRCIVKGENRISRCEKIEAGEIIERATRV